jgi:hypothetical protein
MLKPARALFAVGAAVAAVVTGFAAPAAAATPDPWQPYFSGSFTEAAGDVCPFAVQADDIQDHEEFRTLATYPDGSPQEQEFVGLLVYRYTNLSTGASVVRNLTGTGYFFYQPDGSTTGHGDGHIGLSVHAGNTDPPPGEYVITGAYDFTLEADGTVHFDLRGGTAENLCDTLA